ncbi:hypothetical protein Cni_G25839 [Canna indica]|uniref:Dof-type domain-containing protein n=1 Tax=Canna indica TaxID=4628 RepID=A0AAQ3KYQ8_9LILI|nr:hypothetical protein Cni_G25839 [Canna indica]
MTMGEVDEANSIKLFGTVILKEKKQKAPVLLSRPETEAEAHDQQAPLPCPRCASTETKFCYFNNYNVNQPRHFCRSCHRYWTAGGALRNVPVGAGRRKGRRGGPENCVSENSVQAPARPWLLPPDQAPARADQYDAPFDGGLC